MGAGLAAQLEQVAEPLGGHQRGAGARCPRAGRWCRRSCRGRSRVTSPGPRPGALERRAARRRSTPRSGRRACVGHLGGDHAARRATTTASVKVPPTSTPTRAPSGVGAVASIIAADSTAGDLSPPAPRRPSHVLAAARARRRLPRRRRSGPAAAARRAARRRARASCSPGPPNGDLAAGLDGVGRRRAARRRRSCPAPGARMRAATRRWSRRRSRCPAGAQTLAVTLRAPGRRGPAEVRARPVEGGPEIALGTLEPRHRRARAWAGERRRRSPAARCAIVLDPVPALGHERRRLRRRARSTAPLPGWTRRRRRARPGGGAARHGAARRDGALGLALAAFAPGPGRAGAARAVRGDGTLRLAAGGRAVPARATTALARRAGAGAPGRPRRCASRPRPGRAGWSCATSGSCAVSAAVRGSDRASGPRLVVRGRLGPAGGGLLVELRDPRGPPAGPGARRARGRVHGACARRRGADRGGGPGDRTRIGASRSAGDCRA